MSLPTFKFRDLSLRRKQTLIIMLTSSVVLLLACAAFVAYDVARFRREMVESTSSLAEVVGNSTTAAIDFNDPAAAVQILAALRGEPNIVKALVHTLDGGIFATYVREGSPPPPEVADSSPAGHVFTSNHLHLFRPIAQGGERVGTIELVADLSQLQDRLWRYGGIVAVVFCAAMLAAFALSNWLQRLVSNPILQLAKVARSVALEKNYSVRAGKQSNDELGHLVDGFNEMLVQIQERDAALEAARANLERRVEERTNELAESQSLYHSLVDQMPAGVFRKDAAGRYVFVNSWYCQIKGMATDKILGKTPQELAAWEQAGKDPDNPEAAKETRMAAQGAGHHELIMETGRRIEVEEEYLGLDGKMLHLHAVKSPVFDSAGRIIGTQGMLFDVTARKRADALLRQTEELYRRAIAGAGAVPYSNSFKTSSYVFMGEGIKQLIGYAPHEVNSALWGKIIQKSIMLGEGAGLDRAEAARRVASGELLHWRHDMLITTRDGRSRWISDASVQMLDDAGRVTGSVGILQDITDRKEAEAELEKIHQQLVDASRRGGMAEIATNVLHNVGNVLNSVNVSAGLIVDGVKKSRVPNLAKVVAMLQEHEHDLGTYLTADPQGRQLPGYLAQLSQHFTSNQAALVSEADSLRRNVEHIKEIVSMQQSYAKVGGVKEMVNVVNLVEDSLQMNEGELSRHRVKIVREFETVPLMNVEKHKIVQIVVNLLRNAKHACQESPRPDRCLVVRVARADDRVRISVRDNGIGIPPENLTRIFSHGFTTKKGGHGFGLHGGALAAREMGGSLTVHSSGSGLGAVFTLELPCIEPEAVHE